MAEINTLNRCAVASHKDKIILLNLTAAASMTPEEALNLAGYLVALSGKSFDEFKETYDAICNT